MATHSWKMRPSRWTQGKIHEKKEVEAWVGGKGGGGDYSKTIFDERGH